MKTIRDLDAHFIQRTASGGIREVDHLYQADGVSFTCPQCDSGHTIICWFIGRVPQHVSPGPGRWQPAGECIDDLSLRPSVHVGPSCGWHGWIKNGIAEPA